MSEQPDSVGRFATRAVDYARFRPTYPPAAIDAILAGLGDPHQLDVVDVGAGTGISLGLLAERGCRAVGLEPGPEMREQARAAGLDVRDASATKTGLADGSADLVTAFQAFHWFATTEATTEFARILRAGGRLALVWNYFDRSDPFTEEFAALHSRYGDSARIAALGVDEANATEVVRQAGFGEPRRSTFPWSFENDFDALLGRLRSSSSTPREGPRYDAMVADLRTTLSLFADSAGIVPLAYKTVVFLTEKNAA
jgi:SAM-dependent methyltransferase